MTIIQWLRSRLSSNYSAKSLLARLAMDLFLSNAAFFLGILCTIFFWVFIWHETPQAFFNRILIGAWLKNVPLFSLCCLLSYIVTGLYISNRRVSYLRNMLQVSRAVGTAFFLFLFIIFFTERFMPRSSLVLTFVFLFALIMPARLLWSVFSRHYFIASADIYNPRIEKILKELDLISHHDGWSPPEASPADAAWPYFEDDEILAASAVLQSGKINQWTGQEVIKFQEEFAAACGVKHAIALANGTLALELALKAMGIGAGDEVIVTPRTFIASASCAVLQGAKPVFADVDGDSQNITAESIRQVITSRTKAIICVHLAGWPCDMDAIMNLAAEHGLKVIEDCAQAHGAMYQGKPVGSFGHAAAFSFCQDKIMTTGGEGGMLLTNDDDIWSFGWSYKDHGKSYDAVYNRQHLPGFRWLHESFGTNWRMTEMQAAIGRLQLKKLPGWVQTRRRNANILTEAFSTIDAFRLVKPPAHIYHSYYKYYVFIRPERLKEGWNRTRILDAIIKRGVPCFTGSCSEIYLEKAFDEQENLMRPAQRLSTARELGETSLMLLVHPTLSEKNMQNMASVVKEVMMEAAGKRAKSE